MHLAIAALLCFASFLMCQPCQLVIESLQDLPDPSTNSDRWLCLMAILPGNNHYHPFSDTSKWIQMNVPLNHHRTMLLSHWLFVFFLNMRFLYFDPSLFPSQPISPGALGAASLGTASPASPSPGTSGPASPVRLKLSQHLGKNMGKVTTFMGFFHGHILEYHVFFTSSFRHEKITTVGVC